MHWTIRLALVGAVHAVRTLQANDQHTNNNNSKLPSSTNDDSGTNNSVLTGIGIIAALIGFVVAFFVGYYVGSVTSRRPMTDGTVRSRARAANLVAANHRSDANNSIAPALMPRVAPSSVDASHRQRDPYALSSLRYPLANNTPRATNFQQRAPPVATNSGQAPLTRTGGGGSSSMLDSFRVKRK